MLYLVAFLACGAVFLLLDLLWLGVIARDFYRQEMAHVIAPEFKVGPAVAFYLLYIVGIVYFAILPALRTGDWHVALWTGAFLGLVAYGTYDLTNWAVIRDWPVRLTLLDLAWGTLLTAIAASAGAMAAIAYSARSSS